VVGVNDHFPYFEYNRGQLRALCRYIRFAGHIRAMVHNAYGDTGLFFHYQVLVQIFLSGGCGFENYRPN
jgi:hypothetical protein